MIINESKRLNEDKKSSRELHAMNTDQLRDYAASLGADKNKLYGTSKDVILRMCIDLQKKKNDVNEDVVQKSNGKWTNRGDDGKEHGEFDTKDQALKQMRAMYASGFKG